MQSELKSKMKGTVKKIYFNEYDNVDGNEQIIEMEAKP